MEIGPEMTQPILVNIWLLAGGLVLYCKALYSLFLEVRHCQGHNKEACNIATQWVLCGALPSASGCCQWRYI